MHYADITDAIAGLTITGVTVLDIDQTPETGVDTRAGAILMVDPTSPISDLMTEPVSLGLESSRYRNYRYTINYWLLYCNAGEGRGLADILPGLVSTATAVMEAIAETEFVSAGGMEVTPVVKSCLTLQDASGSSYHGAQIAVQVMEFGEV